MDMKYMKLFKDQEVFFEVFSDEEVGRLFRGMWKYNFYGQEPDLQGNERYIWPVFRLHLDGCRQVATTNANNASSENQAKVSDRETKPSESKRQRNESKRNQAKASESKRHRDEDEWTTSEAQETGDNVHCTYVQETSNNIQESNNKRQKTEKQIAAQQHSTRACAHEDSDQVATNQDVEDSLQQKNDQEIKNSTQEEDNQGTAHNNHDHDHEPQPGNSGAGSTRALNPGNQVAPGHGSATAASAAQMPGIQLVTLADSQTAIAQKQQTDLIQYARSAGFFKSKKDQDKFVEIIRPYSESWIRAAIEQCIFMCAIRLCYLAAILRGYRAAGGIDTVRRSDSPGMAKCGTKMVIEQTFQQRPNTENTHEDYPEWLKELRE